MGNDAKKKADAQRNANLANANTMFTKSQTPSPTENAVSQFTQGNVGNYNNAVKQNTSDYTGMMGNFNNLYSQLAARKPTVFSSPRSAEASKAFSGYGDFADTGGYSPTDIQDLRSRGVAPIRAAYGNAMMETDRAKTLGGSGGSPNYIAAVSRMQRQLPQQLSDATSNVNAGLADSIRQGKLAGLSGLSGMSDAEANRNLQAAGMTEQSYQSGVGNRLSTLGGMNSLYGTTPGMTSIFGNQVMNGFGQGLGAEQNRFNGGLSAIGSSMNQLQDPYYNQKPWWQKGLNIAGKIAPYAAKALFPAGTTTDNSGFTLQ
jgi:hypothetical protein